MPAGQVIERADGASRRPGFAVAGLCLCASAAPGLDEKTAAGAKRQIAALQELKRSLSPAERKLDSRLAVTLRRRQPRGAIAAPGRRPASSVSKSGATEVDVRATAVGGDLLDRLEVASAPSVAHASRAGRLGARRDPARGARQGRRAGRTCARSTWPRRDRPTAVVSEGDARTPPTRARAQHRVTGIGAKLCALSDGVDSLAASQAAGELPAVDVLPGQAGAGDEGTAMLEILHDLAPNAELGFATAFTSDALVRRQHPRAALRGRLRRDRRRRPLLQRAPVPGRPDRAGRQRRHRRRRAVLQLRRQRGQHARRHVRQLRGRLRRLRPRRRQVRRRGARLRSRARPCRSSSRSRRRRAPACR